MSLALDALLAFGSLGLTLAISIGVRIGFRRGRDYWDF